MSDQHEYAEKLKAKIDEWDKELAELEKKLKQVPKELQTGLASKASEFKEKHKAILIRLEEMEDASEGAWHEISKGIEKAWLDLKDGFKNAKMEISSLREDKIDD